MNKMTKGAIATGIGVALLLGGGGTLAVWNVSKEGKPGTVVAGNLNLAAGKGVWESNLSSEAIDDISSYRVIPGEKLTFRQVLTVTLNGDEMRATVKASGTGSGEFGDTAKQGDVNLTLNGEKLDRALTEDDTNEKNQVEVEASTTFEFFKSTSGRTSVNAKHHFENVGYELEQVEPVALAAS